MLAGIALLLATTILLKMKRQRYVWVTLLPALWILVITISAAWLKIFSDNPKVGFLAHADKFGTAHAAGEVLAPAKDLAQMQQVIANDWINALLCSLFLFVLVAMALFAVRSGWRALGHPQETIVEAAGEARA